jgi:hypothetical protein
VICLKLNAIGLVHFSGGVNSLDRWWHRAVVVRRARDRRLQLVDVLELNEHGHAEAQELERLAAVAAESGAAVLVTHGVQPDLAQNLAQALGLVHLPALEKPAIPVQREVDPFH